MNICYQEKDPVNFLYESNTFDELQNRFKKICENYYCEIFGIVRKFKKTNENANTQNEFVCFENYPVEWKNYYISNKYYQKDPVFLSTINLSQAYNWHIDRFKNIDSEQKKILKECSDFGITRGTTIPLLPNNKFDSFLTLVSTNIYDPTVLYRLSNAANVFIERNEYFTRKSKLTMLTIKEQEIFELKIAGYHNKQISHMLSKKHETIALHLKNIRRKFGVFTTEQALAKYCQELTNNLF